MEKIDINKFVLNHIQQIKPFDPAEPLDSMAEKVGVEPEQIIRLNANENPYGPSPSVNEAIQQLKANIYPDPEQNSIRSALSKFTNMPKETILCGAGSDELIDLLFRLFCKLFLPVFLTRVYPIGLFAIAIALIIKQVV